jgi:hypothetical protein
MTGARPYRAAVDLATALKNIEHQSCKLFDPLVVEACLKLYREKRFSFSKKNALPKSISADRELAQGKTLRKLTDTSKLSINDTGNRHPYLINRYAKFRCDPC